MSATGSVVGLKVERPAESAGPEGAAGQDRAALALERLAAAHTACVRLRAGVYPNSLHELAITLLQLFGAQLVVVRDGSGTAEGTAVAPPHGETRAWVEALGRLHLEDRQASVTTFNLEASDPTAPVGGVRRFVVVPLCSGRGHGALWLGLSDHGPSSADELTCLSVLGEHLSLCLERAASKPSRTPPASAGDELISLAAHELRTPLTPITMLLQSLERKARAGTVDVDTILRTRKQVSRLTNMISDLLDLSRLREGRLVVTPVRVDLGKVVREEVQSAQESDPKHRFELVGEAATMEVVSEESRLRHTLSNLLGHVAHATPSGGAIQISLERRDGLAAITVRADRPVFPGDASKIDVPKNDVPKSAAVAAPQHARPEPVALGVLLAEGVTKHQGGTFSLQPTHAHETRAEATFPLATEH